MKKGGKSKISWRLHQFFMNFHLNWESLLTAIDRSGCCHASLHLGAAGKPPGKAGDWNRGGVQPLQLHCTSEGSQTTLSTNDLFILLTVCMIYSTAVRSAVVAPFNFV